MKGLTNAMLGKTRGYSVSNYQLITNKWNILIPGLLNDNRAT